MPTHRDIAAAIESVAPLDLQEEWDNSGFQLGDSEAEATGVTICVDLTDDVIDEALAAGHSMVVTHHPLIFKGVRQLLGRNRVERLVSRAIVSGLTVYSSHTAMDNAVGGVSHTLASMLGLTGVTTLVPKHRDDIAGPGLGAVGDLPSPLALDAFVDRVKACIGSPVVRCSDPSKAPASMISRVALCGGSAAEFLPEAISAGAQVYLTSDSRLNYFLDYRDRIILVDVGHYESEAVTKRIFYHILSGKFPNFALCLSSVEDNPIKYL